MDIYSILSNRPHNKHYLNRYWKFIQNCRHENIIKEELVYTEDHHICPRARDMFPEYSRFKDNPWNKITLTARQHFIAHWILWKAYGGSQVNAFWLIAHTMKGCTIKTSRVYASIKSKRASLERTRQRKLVEQGTHHLQSIKHSIETKALQKKFVEQGTHNFQKGAKETSLRMKRLAEEKKANGIPPFTKEQKEKALDTNRKKFEEGTHFFQSEEQLNRMKNRNPMKNKFLCILETRQQLPKSTVSRDYSFFKQFY